MKKTGWAILLALCCIGGYLVLPSNYYLRRALIHLLPKIDQYPIFENRTIEAGAPQAWIQSEDYNKLSIPEKYLPVFDELGTVAFVIIKDSSLLFEQYWEDYSPKSHSNSFSMAKSIVSLAIGCAIDDGFIKNVDQPVSDFYPEFQGYNGKVLTLRHLLTMSAGVDFDEAYSSPFSPTTKLYYGDDLEKIALGMKETEEPGVNFIYQSGVTQLLSLIVEKDFARFGQLILNKGSWNGRQLVSESYITEATTPDTSLTFKEYNETNHCYGFQFWHLTYKGMEIPYMRGILGQYVFAIPELNAVVVRLGHKRSDTRSAQHYPDDIDTWLGAAVEMIQESTENQNKHTKLNNK